MGGTKYKFRKMSQFLLKIFQKRRKVKSNCWRVRKAVGRSHTPSLNEVRLDERMPPTTWEETSHQMEKRSKQ